MGRIRRTGRVVLSSVNGGGHVAGVVVDPTPGVFSTPTKSITTAIIFPRLRYTQAEFGPARASATFGWMCGYWVIQRAEG
jgi:hypothetical protein